MQSATNDPMGPHDDTPLTTTAPSADGPPVADTSGGPDARAVDEAASPRRFPVWLVAVVAGVVIAAAIGVTMVLREPAPLPGIAREPALTTTGITFTEYGSTDEGGPAALAAAPGGVNLVYFGYLNCPDVCPTTMADIRAGLQDLPDDVQEQVSVTFVTVAPTRDDPESMRTYLGHFFVPPTSIRVMHADDDTMDQSATQLGVIYEVEDHAAGDDDYDVAHSAITYVVDDTGTVVRELPFGAPPEDFATIVTAVVD